MSVGRGTTPTPTPTPGHRRRATVLPSPKALFDPDVLTALLSATPTPTPTPDVISGTVQTAEAVSTAASITTATATATATAGLPFDLTMVVDMLDGMIPREVLPVVVVNVINILVGDIRAVFALDIEPTTIFRLFLTWYLFLSRPSPFATLLDLVILSPISMLTSPRIDSMDFGLRDRLGGGNYGVTYEALQLNKKSETENKSTSGRRSSFAGQLTPEQKKRRVVLKKVGENGGAKGGKNGNVRNDFLLGGTVAMGAAETGVVESYMNRKLRRSPFAGRVAAKFRGDFVVEETDGPFTKGSRWLAFDFESDATLSDALEGNVGPYPEALADIMLRGKINRTWDEEKIAHETIKTVIQRILRYVSGGMDATNHPLPITNHHHEP